jgi:hypothetical protein
MRSLARDIRITLLIKFSLLIILWIICFKGVEKPSMNTREWLLGTELNAHQSSGNTVQKN